MVRGLPYSIVIHTVTLLVVFVYGSHVSKPIIRPERTFKIKLAKAPAEKSTAPEQPIVETIEPVEAAPPKPQPKIQPKLEPKQLPEKPKDLPKPKEIPPKPAVKPPPQKNEETAKDSDPALVAPTGPSVSATDQPFEFAYYLNLLEGRISRQWNPRQLGFRDNSVRSCRVHFIVDRRGYISQVTVNTSSGVALFDREALRAVQAAQPLPPLPQKYTARSLGVSFVFTLESGL